MSIKEFIKTNRKQNSGGGNKPAGGGGGSLKLYRSVGHQKAENGDTSEDLPKQLLLTNLEWAVTEEQLFDMFAEYGKIKEVKIFHHANGRSLGKALVVFNDCRDAYNAQMYYNKIDVNGRKLLIKLIYKIDEKNNVALPHRNFEPKPTI